MIQETREDMALPIRAVRKHTLLKTVSQWTLSGTYVAIPFEHRLKDRLSCSNVRYVRTYMSPEVTNFNLVHLLQWTVIQPCVA